MFINDIKVQGRIGLMCLLVAGSCVGGFGRSEVRGDGGQRSLVLILLRNGISVRIATRDGKVLADRD